MSESTSGPGCNRMGTGRPRAGLRTNGRTEQRAYGTTGVRNNGRTEQRAYGTTGVRNNGRTEQRAYEQTRYPTASTS
ncbi:hypothetical protein HNR23_004207 [Nocardiopsis mwathae]|uniref:Uncharacterized protein n=1 Tax=Nocardiopsis mwathae TaxID=1472723 RepID=A0A7W9YL30_9ACTN|nr:hypothetical protein [Nocardiopsis mwathae]